MKKSVVTLIALIYVASIAIVGFLGLQAKTYNDVIYVDSIEILSDYTVDTKTGSKYITFKTAGDDRSLKIDSRVLPEDATDKGIVYKLDRDCTSAVIDEVGNLTFVEGITRPTSVKVYIYSYQNPTISDEILVYYIP